MGNPNSLEFSPVTSLAEHPHMVNKVVKTLDVDKKYKDDGVVFYTELVEMDDGIRYIATSNVIESDEERAKSPADKEFPGSDIVDLEGSAWITKYGKLYRDRNTALALDFHRPSLFVGVQQNTDRYVNLNRSTDDMLAIHAFMACRYGYDLDNLTTKGTSRGGMLSINLQKRAPRYGQRVLYNYSMVPSVPETADTFKMIRPGNLWKMIKNEVQAAKDLGYETDELLQMHDMLDVLSIRSLAQQLKEGIALGFSNIGPIVQKSANKDDVGDVKVQHGDRLSYAFKWPGIFKDHHNTNVEILPDGGHGSCVGKSWLEDWREAAEASSTVLHSHPEARKFGNDVIRQLIDAKMRPLRAVE